MARPREHGHAPVGDRRTKDRLTDQQRAFNRCQAGCARWWTVDRPARQRLGVAPLAGLLYRLRDVDRAAGALICLGRWLHRVPN